ncbi:MAG: 50S ribosomal protein L11 methyltransferase [Rickettsiaceae bacterium]|nr:50S ribosomal protein L11 methyltransferase [Rickettsiaceae bacterium]
MNNPFSQPKVTHKICFVTNFKSIEIFENFFCEDTPGISTFELNSSTIDSQDDDLWGVEAYLWKISSFKKIQQDIKSYADKHNILLASEVTIELIEDKDWVMEYQKQQKPIDIGRFVITSTGQLTNIDASKTPIYIEASRAFGTGDHATTSLCIEAMESLESQDISEIFDVGTGSGILSFAAEKIWPRSNILACDIEEISVKLANDNLIFNNSHVQFYQNTEDGLNVPKEWNRPFDLIVSNILAQPLIAMAKSFKQITHTNSKIILSGFLDYQKQDIEIAYKNAGFVVDKALEQDKWVSLILSVNKDY